MLISVALIGAGFIGGQVVKSHMLRKIFNFWREFKIVNRERKTPNIPKFNQVIDNNATLIGYQGRKPVFIPDHAKHVFVCGTTGSGKTVALTNFVQHIIYQQLPAVIVDGKGDLGDGSILDVTTKMAMQAGRKLYVINLSDVSQSDRYNPFKNATPTVAKDMLINMSDWSEEHYKLNAERYIQRILQLLELAKIQFSFKRIVGCIPVEKFGELSAHLLKEELITKEEHLENLELAKTSGKIAQSSMARFSTIAEGELKDVLIGDGVDISQAMQENAIILFVLNPLVFPELSPAFGRLIIIDEKQAIGNLFKSKNQRAFFIMDEISSYATTGLTDLVNKSRSANVTCVLATQSLSDLDAVKDESFKEQIIENCNNYIIMRQNSPVNAEHWAEIIGTRQTMDTTYQIQQQSRVTSTTGLGSARRVREFIYHPEDIKNLTIGKGIYLSKDTNYHGKIDINKPF